MPDRAVPLENMLTSAGWSEAARSPLAGDASNRKYLRLDGPNGRAVLMDADPATGEDIRPFVAIARHLSAAGLHPPAILGEDAAAGYLLLEDLGDRLFARVVADDPELEKPLYTGAVDVLLHLHSIPAPDLPAYDTAKMAEAAMLAPDWYAGRPKATQAINEAVANLLTQLDWSSPVVVLRDYHAENLLDCPDETGLRAVGLLDFQDAMLGHPVYDLVSLLQDARRDVSDATVTAMKSHFVAKTGSNAGEFDLAFAALGAQRALRILGVFARLSLLYGKPGYVDLIPRVWGQLQTNLSHPALGDLARAVEVSLPQPETTLLEDLKARCGTHQRAS